MGDDNTGPGNQRIVRLRIPGTAGFLLASAVVTAPLHPFFPMSPRGAETGVNDTMHIVLTLAFSLFIFCALAASAVAMSGWFRLFAIASLLVIMGFGAMTGPLMNDIANNRPTPWLGAFERVNAYTTVVWMVVLAATLLSRASGPRDHTADGQVRSLRMDAAGARPTDEVDFTAKPEETTGAKPG